MSDDMEGKFPILEDRNILWTGEKWENKNGSGENELLAACWVWILSPIFLASFHRKIQWKAATAWEGCIPWKQRGHVAARVVLWGVRGAETRWINNSVGQKCLRQTPEFAWTHCGVKKTLMLRKIEGGRRREQQRTIWFGDITDSMDMSLGKLQGMVRTGKPGVPQSMGSQRARHNWATAQCSVRKNLLFFICLARLHK